MKGHFVHCSVIQASAGIETVNLKLQRILVANELMMTVMHARDMSTCNSGDKDSPSGPRCVQTLSRASMVIRVSINCTLAEPGKLVKNGSANNVSIIDFDCSHMD